MRQTFSRGVKWKGECGHINIASTSFYRLNKDREACIRGNILRGGGWCKTCNTRVMPVEWLGTARMCDS